MLALKHVQLLYIMGNKNPNIADSSYTIKYLMYGHSMDLYQSATACRHISYSSISEMTQR